MNRTQWISIGLIVAVIAVTAAMYGSLPERIPMHWNIKGEIDGWASKPWGASFVPLLMIGLFLMFRALPWLSPKQFTLDSFRSTFDFIVLIFLVFCAYMQGVTLWAAIKGQFDASRVIVGGVCLLFVTLGNVLGKVRRNFWVGVRTPWTIASDRVWNATHRLSAKLFVGAGVLGLLVTVSGLPQLPSFVVMFSGIMLAALFPVGYSLYLYKVLEKRGELEPQDEQQSASQ